MHGIHQDVVGHGPPLVLIHGTAGSNTRWAEWVERLADDYTLLLPDLPGSGKSPDEEGHLDLSTAALQAAQSASAVTEGPYHVVGYSLGALVALAWACERPDKVRSLLLLGGWLRTDAKMRAVFRLWMRLLREHGARAFLDYAIVHGHAPDVLERLGDAGIDQEVSEALPEIRVEGALQQCDLDLRVDVSALASKITCPTVVVGGTHDQFVSPAAARALSDAIPTARYVEVACGHGDLPDDPSVFATMRELHAT